MKKTIDFGCIDYTGNGQKNNRITVNIEYKKKENGQKVFTVSGEIWNAYRSDCLRAGQCLDTLAEYLNDNPLFMEIFRLWKLYHLNDMHAECEHQEALGWREKASETRYIYEWSFTPETSKEQNRIKKELMEKITNGETVKASDREQEILKLKHFYKTTTDHLPEHLKAFYKDKPHKVHQVKLGHTTEAEHPEGLLCKPCPVCGYKYGTAWTYRPISVQDEQIIYIILKDEG